jgi:hypothetical protein
VAADLLAEAAARGAAALVASLVAALVAELAAVFAETTPVEAPREAAAFAATREGPALPDAVFTPAPDALARVLRVRWLALLDVLTTGPRSGC